MDIGLANEKIGFVIILAILIFRSRFSLSRLLWLLLTIVLLITTSIGGFLLIPAWGGYQVVGYLFSLIAGFFVYEILSHQKRVSKILLIIVFANLIAFYVQVTAFALGHDLSSLFIKNPTQGEYLMPAMTAYFVRAPGLFNESSQLSIFLALSLLSIRSNPLRLIIGVSVLLTASVSGIATLLLVLARHFSLVELNLRMVITTFFIILLIGGVATMFWDIFGQLLWRVELFISMDDPRQAALTENISYILSDPRIMIFGYGTPEHLSARFDILSVYYGSFGAICGSIILIYIYRLLQLPVILLLPTMMSNATILGALFFLLILVARSANERDGRYINPRSAL